MTDSDWTKGWVSITQRIDDEYGHTHTQKIEKDRKKAWNGTKLIPVFLNRESDKSDGDPID